jgi:hypothetical protein
MVNDDDEEAMQDDEDQEEEEEQQIEFMPEWTGLPINQSTG